MVNIAILNTFYVYNRIIWTGVNPRNLWAGISLTLIKHSYTTLNNENNLLGRKSSTLHLSKVQSGTTQLLYEKS